jgi:hypothetical protein
VGVCHLAYILFLAFVSDKLGSWFGYISPVISVLFFVALLPITVKGLYIFFNHFTNKASIKSLSKIVMNSLKHLKLLNQSCRLKVIRSADENGIEVSLLNASFEEERIFNDALVEFLSLVEDPRYIAIKKGFIKKRNFRISYAIPSVFANKKDVKIFEHYLNWSMGTFNSIYTRSVYGKVNILHYIKDSYVVRDSKIESKHKVI